MASKANKNGYCYPLRLSEDVLRRLILLSQLEGRTVNNQLLLLIRNAVAYHERARGKLDPRELAALDLSAYAESGAGTESGARRDTEPAEAAGAKKPEGQGGEEGI